MPPDMHQAVLNLLPVAVTLEDGRGACVLMNDAARRQQTSRPSSSPALGADEPHRSLAAPALDDCAAVEETLRGEGDERTLLTWRQPVCLNGEAGLLSASLDITEQKRRQRNLERRAYFDELTGLPNRLFVEEHARALLEGRKGDHHFALAFLDIDNFKHINDYYTHAIGDSLLRHVADRISKRIRPTDLLGRISGDEFLLVLEPIEHAGWLAQLVEEIAWALKEPFFVEGFEIFTSASIGVSICPLHGETYEALRKSADSAMYHVKSGIKGGAAVFDWNIGRAVVARIAQEQRLRLAVKDGKFSCAFQPKVDIHTEEVVGVEALIRLCDEGGVIDTPREFIGLATKLGLVDDLAHIMLARIMDSLEDVEEMFGAGVPISINVAAQQASNPTFMRTFCDELESTGRAQRFMIEVTEDAFMAGGPFQEEVLPLLRDIGVRVSIDDFGTGYSSLSVLADIIADEIKVDRSFITNIHRRARSQSVLKAIEALAETLGMTIVAEGIETAEELAYLQGATRIGIGQGFYFSRPVLVGEGAGAWASRPRLGAAALRHAERQKSRQGRRI
jgi:diguanylate cyclase (GGDEF)-like protein